MTIRLALYLAAMLFTSLFSILFTMESIANDKDWYVSGRFSFGRALMEEITHKGTIGTGEAVGNDFDGSLAHDNIHDGTAGIGLAVGRSIGQWDIETEFIWRYRPDWDIAATTYSLQAITNVFTNVGTSTLLFNATRRFPINANWTWELGAGIGLVVNQMEGEYIEREVPGVRPQVVFDDENTTTDFSWNLIASVSRRLSDDWSVKFRYRYIDLGDLHVGPFTPRPGEVFAEQMSHDFVLSIDRRL